MSFQSPISLLFCNHHHAKYPYPRRRNKANVICLQSYNIFLINKGKNTLFLQKLSSPSKNTFFTANLHLILSIQYTLFYLLGSNSFSLPYSNPLHRITLPSPYPHPLFFMSLQKTSKITSVRYKNPEGNLCHP